MTSMRGHRGAVARTGRAGALVVAGALLAALLALAAPARPATAASGDLEAFAGTGTLGWSGDGGAALSAQLQVQDVATDGLGNTYVLGYEPVNSNTVVRKIAPGGTITTIAGNGDPHLGGPFGEGGPATEAFLGQFPQAIDVDGAGNVYVLGTGRVWKITPGGTLVGVVGGSPNGASLADTYLPAGSAQFGTGWMAVAPTGEVWFGENGSTLTGGPALWKADGSGFVRLVAGLAGPGTGGDGGDVAAAQFQSINFLTVDASGNLYVGDGARVRKVATSGTVTTVAGQADQFGYDGDGGPATSAQLVPGDLAVGPTGALFVADAATHVVRRVAGGTITTVAGTPGVGAPGGDGGPATAASLRGPDRLAVLPAGDVLVGEPQDSVVRRIVGSGGSATPGSSGMVTASAGPRSAFVSWAAPGVAGGGPILGYSIQASPGGAALAVGNVTSATFPGLTDGTAYTFTVRARNAHGAGPASPPSAATTPRSAPGAPTAVSAFPAPASALLEWAAPASTGGVPLTGYQVTVSPGGTVLELGTATSTTVTGLTNGTSYTFTVRARSATAMGPPSGPSAAVVPSAAAVVPSVPLAVTATAGASSVNLTWAPPAHDGGSAVTGYRIAVQPGGATLDVGAVVAASVPNLVDGVSYRFTVAATSAVGTGAPSSLSNPATPAGPGDIYTLAGGGGDGDGMPATQVGLTLTGPMAKAPDGTLYLGAAHQLRKVAPDGTISHFGPEWWGEDGPSALAVDAAGNVYVGEGPYVYVVTPTGAVDIWAGAGLGFGSCIPWQEEPAASMPRKQINLCDVRGLAFDPSGNLVVADAGNDLVRRITPGGTATIIAGAGALTGEGANAHDSAVLDPVGVAVDTSGRTYVLQSTALVGLGYGYVRRIASGTITTVAGTVDGSGTTFDGQPATGARLNPTAVAIDSGGGVLLVEIARIRRVAGGALTTLVGTGVLGDAGDGLAPTDVAVRAAPSAVVADGSGAVWFTNRDSQTSAATVRKVSGGLLSTVAGNHEVRTVGDGLPATAVPLSPYGVATDAAGNTYVGDYTTSRVRKIGPDGIITTVAGNGVPGHSGDGGPATSASIMVEDLAVDGLGNLYIGSNGRLRKVTPGGTISTVWQQSEGPLAPYALSPIAADASGNVYVAIREDQVAKITPAGVKTVYAGDPDAVVPGDGGPATAAGLVGISDLAIDASGRLVIADQWGGRVRKVTGTTISTVAGDPAASALGDGGPATAAQLHPTGVAVDATGALFVSDGTDDNDPRIRKVAGGTITTVAGGNGRGGAGDGGPGTAAQVDAPADLAVLPGNRLVVTDDDLPRVRVLVPGSSPASVPSPPRDVAAAILGGSPRTAWVSWTAPSTSGGSPITGYRVTASPGGATATVGADQLAASIPNLTIGTAYTFTVQAQNAIGFSQPSAPTTPVTPVMEGEVPGLVPFATAEAGDGVATVSWSAPASDGGLAVIGYTVTRSPGGQQVTTDALTFNATFTGLTNGTSYTFTVQAENGNGLGAGKVSNAVVPHGAATAPGAPTGVVAAVAGFGAAKVSWVLPPDGGSALTSITATSTPGGFTCTAPGSATDCTVVGLANGASYRFSVVATNAVGSGPASALSNEVTIPTVSNCGPGFVGPFADVPGDHRFCTDIEWLSSQGITGGFGDGGFHPSAAVTRQSVAAFLYRYAGRPAFVPPNTPTFADVPATHPFFLEVEWLADSGITGGFADGGFHPAAPVTRQSMAAFLHRYAGKPAFTPPATATFTDVPTDHRFFTEIEWLADTGITGGFADGGYHPSDPVSRQAMAAFLHRYDNLALDGSP